MIGGKGKKCLGISELPIVDSFSCGEEIGNEGMNAWGRTDVRELRSLLRRWKFPPGHWMAPLSDFCCFLCLLMKLASVNREGQIQL